MNRSLIAGLAALTMLAGMALTGSAQTGPESPCITGAKWHYAQAAHWMNHDDQDFHVKAGDALVRLNDLGADCNGWDQDATRPGPDGSGDAASQDALQSSVQAGRAT